MIIANPWMLLLLIPLAVLLIYAWRRPMPSIRIPSIRPFKEAASSSSKFSIFRIPFILYAIAITLIVLALAKPREGLEEIKQRAEGIDIMLAIDLSGSMQAIDVPKHITSEQQLLSELKSGKLRNRLETAKKEVKNFIERRPNDRIGLIGFAPLPYNACPPTLDHGWLIRNLDRLTPGIIGDKTGIAGPIASAVHRLKNTESKRRVLVLFTDGSNNVEAKITPRQAAKLAREFDVTIYTVGIGSNRAYVLQDSFFGQQFMPLERQFDEPLMKDIAKVSDGKYYRAADAEGMKKVMDEIDKLEKTTVEQPKIIDYRELAPYLMTAAGLLILAAFLLENTVLLRIP